MRPMMQRQRGFGTLIIIGIAAIMITGAIGTFAYQMRSAGKAAGVAQEKPKIEAAELRATNAEQRALQLEAALSDAVQINQRNIETVQKLNQQFAETKKTLNDIQTLQDQQQEKTRAALATFTEREKRQANEIKRLREIAASPTTITIQDGGLSEADTILRTAIRDLLGLRKP